MPEYIKTPKNYYYKIYKNGKKKRISKDEYNKKYNKNGGGTETELENEKEFFDKLKNKLKSINIENVNIKNVNKNVQQNINELLENNTNKATLLSSRLDILSKLNVSRNSKGNRLPPLPANVKLIIFKQIEQNEKKNINRKFQDLVEQPTQYFIIPTSLNNYFIIHIEQEKKEIDVYYLILNSAADESSEDNTIQLFKNDDSIYQEYKNYIQNRQELEIQETALNVSVQSDSDIDVIRSVLLFIKDKEILN